MNFRNRLFILLVVVLFSFSFNVYARDYCVYIDTTCEVDEEDCFKTLDEGLTAYSGDKLAETDSVSFVMIDKEASISKSYSLKGSIKFVVDDVEDYNFQLNGNHNTITVDNNITFTGNSKLNISNLNFKDNIADASNGSFTLCFMSDIVNLNSISVISLKYMGIMGGSNLSHYKLDSVQVSGAETGLDYLGEELDVTNSTFEDNTMGFAISSPNCTITNSKINSIRAYENSIVNIDKTNTLVNNPLMFFVKDDHDEYLDVDLDKYFVVSTDTSSIVKMNLVKDSDIVIGKNGNKIDIFKLFNGVNNISLDTVSWTSSNEKVASIKDGYVILNDKGEATVSGKIPNTDTTLTVNFKVSKEEKNSFVSNVKSIVTNPKTYSNLFLLFMFVVVISGTLIVFNNRRNIIEEKDII